MMKNSTLKIASGRQKLFCRQVVLFLSRAVPLRRMTMTHGYVPSCPFILSRIANQIFLLLVLLSASELSPTSVSDCYGQEFPHSELNREESQQETQDRKPRQTETETDPPTVPEASPNTVLPAQLKLKFHAKYPHTPSAYCQGLYYEYDAVGKRGILYESTGRYGRSQLRCTDLKTGKSLSEINLAADFFGEGLAVVNNRIYQLTWQERTCFVYDKQTFRLLDEFRYPGEGWGLAWDGSSLIMSDGSDTLRFLDPQNFRRQKTLRVTYKEKGR
ncbi:MAG: glutaminyl-peptide cyclotransferase, partial [Thermoguttaceae bacterium]|nr:glutaminyl-peptide cyclotransferase [Thermoguttaceae bacterium]